LAKLKALNVKNKGYCRRDILKDTMFLKNQISKFQNVKDVNILLVCAKTARIFIHRRNDEILK